MKPCDSVERQDPVQEYLRRQGRRRWLIFGAILFLLIVAVYWGIFAEIPRDHADIREHFKYGSIGAEAGAGIPYWIWQVLPDMFPQHLPEPDRFRAVPADKRTAVAGYAQFGFIFADGQDVPIGFSKRRRTVELVGLNCAVCHVGTVKVTKDMDPDRIYGAEPEYASAKRDRVIVYGTPSHTVDLSAYIEFLIQCGGDAEFTEDNVMRAITGKTKLGLLDRFFYRRAVRAMREGLAKRKQEMAFLGENPAAGPGRVDTFNPYKTGVFGFPSDHTIGTADFPSIWNQRAREGLHLHWDGDNTSVFERNISASLGAGATPVSLDMPRMLRVAYWLGAPDPHQPLTLDEIEQARAHPLPRPGELPVPKYPFPIDAALAARGETVYHEYCAACHAWSSPQVGQIVPIDKIGTDRYRLDSFTAELAANQNTLGAEQWWRFRHFRKTNGYVNMPLDGLWARAPYLHNGSVPTLRDLLDKSADRPPQFYRGDDEYDPAKVGFRSDRPRSDEGRKLFLYKVREMVNGQSEPVPGNGNQGHEGRAYGTELPDAEKEALVEYLKKL